MPGYSTISSVLSVSCTLPSILRSWNMTSNTRASPVVFTFAEIGCLALRSEVDIGLDDLLIVFAKLSNNRRVCDRL